MDMITLAMAKGYADSQRLGYMEIESVTLFSDAVASPANGAGGLAGAARVSDTPEKLIPGETYIVTVNGDSQKYTCFAVGSTPYIGNLSVYNPTGAYENTGEDFFIMQLATYIAVKNGRTEDITVSCTRYSETIHPIDQKFIPVMDSLTLNGADGKQYKIAVDASGALTATAQE